MTLPTLVSPRLVLRPLVHDDAEALHAVFSDEETMRYWSCAPHADLARTRDYVAANAAQADWLTWAITETGETALGWVTLGARRAGVRELGYVLSRDLRGKGYAREAVAAVIDHGFGPMRLRRIFADTDPDNAGSIRLLESLGFRGEGQLRAEWETHIGIRDSLIFGLLAGEWR